MSFLDDDDGFMPVDPRLKLAVLSREPIELVMPALLPEKAIESNCISNMTKRHRADKAVDQCIQLCAFTQSGIDPVSPEESLRRLHSSGWRESAYYPAISKKPSRPAITPKKSFQRSPRSTPYSELSSFEKKMIRTHKK